MKMEKGLREEEVEVEAEAEVVEEDSKIVHQEKRSHIHMMRIQIIDNSMPKTLISFC